MKSVFALVDCNNFFVSCERLFRPELENRPVVVLSSNDGCVVSRSNQAKALGIPMGAPAFKYKQLFQDQGVVQFSANFELYGDISQRITVALSRLTPRIEVYSVDESFLELSELKIHSYQAWGQAVRYSLKKEVGIPVAIGIAPTKTLAKIATERAKKDLEANNVLDLYSIGETSRQGYLARTLVNDVWGVGWRLTPMLRAEGVQTALDLSKLRPRYAQQLMGIHGRQMVAELNGQTCYPLEASGKSRKSLMHGRMFGEDTNQFTVVEAAIASLCAKAAKQLRADGLLAKKAVVHLSTSRHKPGYQRFSRSVNFLTPTADSGQLTREIVRAAETSFSSHTWIHRANVTFYDLIDEQQLQPDLTGEVDVRAIKSSKARFEAVDAINSRYGRSTVRLAAEDLSSRWQPKRTLKSPRYTTEWAELPILKAGN